jgi:hypothetical protein
LIQHEVDEDVLDVYRVEPGQEMPNSEEGAWRFNPPLKIDGVLSLPNLRIFVYRAWTSLEIVQEAVGQDYVIMWRQKAVPHVAAARGLSG